MTFLQHWNSQRCRYGWLPPLPLPCADWRQRPLEPLAMWEWHGGIPESIFSENDAKIGSFCPLVDDLNMSYFRLANCLQACEHARNHANIY